MTLKLRLLRSLTRMLMILVSLTSSLFTEKMLISNRYISGLMPNLIKKSWTVSTKAELLLLFCQIIWLFESWCRYGWLGSLKLEWLSQNLNVCLKSSTSHISNTPISFSCNKCIPTFLATLQGNSEQELKVIVLIVFKLLPTI